MLFQQNRKWFISHPSGGLQHTPTFFTAINNFAVTQKGIDFILPHDKENEVKLTREDITQCELVLVEVSISSTGSGIELGWAHAANKPIIAFHQGGSDPSPAIKFVAKEIYSYVTEDHIIQVLQKLASWTAKSLSTARCFP